MALAAYQTAVISLIQAPSSPTPLIPTGTLTTYINTARAQVAADAECIRTPGNLVLLPGGAGGYSFGSFVTAGATVGFGSVINIRSGRIGTSRLDIRPWEWFAQYYWGSATTGTPTKGAQQGQGVGGTFFVWPTPTTTITATFDVVCLPIPLTSDTIVEAIPDLFADAVEFYAAWLAMQQLQRQNDANAMFARYQEVIRRGRQTATPSELPDRQPGGMGTQMAGAHTTLGSPQAQRAGR